MAESRPDITFVVTKSGNQSLFERNIAMSPCIAELQPDRLIIQQGFPSAAAAYNAAIDAAKTDLIVFCHQDVYFPSDWIENLSRSLEFLDRTDPNWGVVGCSGVNIRGQWAAYLYSTGLGIVGRPFEYPTEIDTLDEFILILRKSSGLRFDPSLPHFHFYGTDICMSARKAGKKCYAVPAFSIHNTSYGPLSDDFFRCYWPIRKKWKDSLPIQTTCIRITRWNNDYVIQRLRRFADSIFARNAKLLPRLEDPRSALRFAGLSSPDDIESSFIGHSVSPKRL